MKQLPATLTKTLSVIALASFSALFISNLAFAQNAPSAMTITAIPPRLGEEGMLRLTPGEKTQTDVRVRNSTDKAITIDSSVIDFIVGEDGVTPIPLEGSENIDNRWSLSSWVALVPGQQVVQPNETAGLAVVIDTPIDALPGGHYAMITHQPVSGALELDGNGAGSGVNQRVGTLLYAIVEGPIQESAFVRNFTFPSWSEFGPVPYNFVVENGSDVHIRPQIAIEIHNLFGQKVETITQETKNIFPLDRRSFEGQWNRIWGFGPYTAKLVMSYGAQGAVVIAKTSFWLLPIKLMIAIVTMLGIFIIAGMSIRRHLMHRKNDQSKRIQELETQVKQMQNQSETDQPQN